MMIKQFSNMDWDFGVSPVELVKFSSKGLVGKDHDVLVRRAGAEVAHKIAKLEIPDHCEPAHVIAMGSTDRYSSNRNGDGFSHDTLRRTHDTFQKNAHAYRHHKNKDPEKRYGEVKLAFFNEPMSRVELINIYYGNEKVAEERGGLLADLELEKMAKRDPFSVSMSCRVPLDICAVCHNKAASRKEYCDSVENGGSCPLFGCKHGLTKVSSTGRIQYVDNPDPDFFDISNVTRGADRIAFALPADYLRAGENS